MANTGVTGRVVTAGTTSPIPGLWVEAVDLDAVPYEQVLGAASTGVDGRFTISYLSMTWRQADLRPDIVVRVYDSYRRLLHETPEFPDVTATTLTIPDIGLANGNVYGWLVTNALANPAGTPRMLSQGNAVEFYVDNEATWRELTDALTAAASSINFSQLYFDVPGVIAKFTPASPPVGSKVTGQTLEDELVKAARDRKVTTRVLVNDFSPDAFGNLDTAGEVESYFKGKPVDVRYYRTIPLAPMHAKTVVVDGAKAYSVASPILQEYFDGREHKAVDPRRGAMGVSNAIKAPIHDVSARVVGPAVGDIDRTFTLMWNALAPSGATPLAPTTGQPPQNVAGACAVQVVRTLEGGRYSSPAEGETGVLEAYQRAIGLADNLIYIEDQYFTSPDIATSLALALRAKPPLRVIMLLNCKVDIPGYSTLQPRAVRQLLDAARRDGTIDRIGIFTVWSHEAATPKYTIIRNYLHSKVAIVDNSWATVGSANLDGASLNMSQVPDAVRAAGTWPDPRVPETLRRAGVRPSQHAIPGRVQAPRNTELNLVIYNGVANLPTTTVIDGLRRELWREHLGYGSAADPALTTPPTGGWLALFRKRADEKLTQLKADPTIIHPARILPWAYEQDQEKYLKALGIDVTKLTILKQVRSFDFATGAWKD